MMLSAGAALLSLAASELDHLIPVGRSPIFLYGGDQEGARTLLATIAGAMVTVAGVTFSVTVVALSLASSQLGPRLLLNFMRDRGNQFVLGTFIGTYLFCLLALGSSSKLEAFVPRVSATMALGLAVVSVVVLIYFIHHVATSIRADHVIDGVACELEAAVQRVFPDGDTDIAASDAEENEGPDFSKATLVGAPSSGYVQAVDEDGLVGDAESGDAVIEALVRAGHFVAAGEPLAAVCGPGRSSGNLTERIQGRFLLGRQRTPEQDPEYGVRQLVEVALRALSPGLNDPNTAVTCVDWLGAILSGIARRPARPMRLYDDEGTLRVLVDPVSFNGLVESAFNQIRQNARGNPAVSMRILEALRRMAASVEDPQRKAAVLDQAKLVFESAKAADLQDLDRTGLEERYRALLESASDSAE
jgi:uncharacterized membrane protein